MVRTRLRLAATLAVVVLALTGFQTSGSGGHGGGSGKSGSKSGKSRSGGGDGGGGGCSSSKKKNDDYDYTDTTDGTGNGSGGANGSTYTPSPTTGPGSGIEVEVVDCVEPAQKKRKGKPARKADTTATVRVTAPDGEAGRYRIVLEFERADGSPADRGEVLVDLTGGGSRLYDVAMRTPGSVGQVKHCVVDAVTPQSASAAPAPTASGTPSSSS
ncbi:hypothetical protein [Streptomyces showdoensis]|uniref:Secreted protein n=1 Tax=Streptomyces showdoensis TaxID=68268 RepID=A0A2P2GS23_STREW|nr:hypothetical protein [Streptomyces showdoensis]KKZ74300.1 hypothetical protein VO63_07560 [Streptomyces showdoensis]